MAKGGKRAKSKSPRKKNGKSPVRRRVRPQPYINVINLSWSSSPSVIPIRGKRSQKAQKSNAKSNAKSKATTSKGKKASKLMIAQENDMSAPFFRWNVEEEDNPLASPNIRRRGSIPARRSSESESLPRASKDIKEIPRVSLAKRSPASKSPASKSPTKRASRLASVEMGEGKRGSSPRRSKGSGRKEVSPRVQRGQSTRCFTCNTRDDKIYCGNKCYLPDASYTRFGTPFECMQKGMMVGKKMQVRRTA